MNFWKFLPSLPMRIIGLTGGIATGKSTISSYLVAKDIPVIDADILARKVVEPGRKGYICIVDHFGTSILNEDKTINRVKLGSIIFNDADKRKLLNRCTHPYIKFEAVKALLKYWIKGKKLVILDFPLLYESGLDSWVGSVVVVYCPESLQRQRLMKRNNLSDDEAGKRIEGQLSIEEKKNRADFVIDNSGPMEESFQQADDILRHLQPSLGEHLFHWLGWWILSGGLLWGILFKFYYTTK